MALKSGMDLINEAKTRITEVSAATVKSELGVSDAVIIDCREPQEWNLGRIPGSMFIPRGTLETKIEGAVPRDANIIIYCAGGNRSALAADTLQQMGYEKVRSMAAGWRGWMEVDGPVEG